MKAWTSGNVAGTGTFRCTDCDHSLSIEAVDELPACANCGGTEFVRASLVTTAQNTVVDLPAVLDEQAQVQLRQALVLRLRVLVPAFFIPTAVSGIAVTVLDGFDAGFWFRCVGVLAMLSWILIRVIGTVPINSATLTWQPSAPPKNWKAQVDHAERFHIVGVWVAVLAFAFFLSAVALKLATH